MADSQIVHMRKWLRSGKLKKAYPTVRKSIGVQRKKAYPPCVRIASGYASGYAYPLRAYCV